MLMGVGGDPYLIEVDGDFGDESSLMYFATDEKGKLIEVGGVRGGGFVNYLEDDADVPWISYSEDEKNYQESYERDAASQAERETESYLGTEEYEARYAERYAEIYDELYSAHLESQSNSKFPNSGKYIGQTDENGIPNGYGYYETNTIYNDIAIGPVFMSKLGKWKDGHIEGYYTERQSFDSRSYREDGCIQDGQGVGDFVSSDDQTFSDGTNKGTVVTMNLDEVNSYQLCDDGAYRTGYRRTDYYFDDGSYGFQEVRYRKDSNASGYMTYLVEHCVREGSYCNYDKIGNVID